MLAKIRRMHFRDGMSLREVARRTGLSRNTVRGWLRRPKVVEPRYPARRGASKLDGWTELLATWLKTDGHRARRERRTATMLFAAIRALGYSGGYGRVSAFVRRWKAEEADSPRRAAYVPLAFELGEAFQFDWSCEYAFVGGLRRRLELAHVKLAASRAFWRPAYFARSLQLTEH
jgi:transposase